MLPTGHANSAIWLQLRHMIHLEHMSELLEYPRPRDLKRRPRPISFCGLCRRTFDKKTRPKTKDHVIPDGWFNDKAPANLPTWPACLDCQRDLEPREDALRSLFAAGHSHHPEELTSVYAKAARSTRQPVPIGRRPVLHPNGLWVMADVAAPNQEDLDVVFRKIATGLYWYREHQLPPEDRWVVRLMSSPDHAKWTNILRPSYEVQHLGPECWWMSAHNRDEKNWDVWLFVIFGAVPVGVFRGDALDFAIPQPSGVCLRNSL